MENKSVVIIGGGPAGIEAANSLANQGLKVTLIEKSDEAGGNIRNWVKLFPDFSNAEDVRANFRNILKNENIEFISNTEISSLYRDGNHWIAKNGSDKTFKADAALLTTGFEVFDAKRKEELGYGIYDNVITSVDFEQMYKSGKITTAEGKVPERIAFLNCVGSRDEKVGNHYCSRVCCINAVKQAIEFKELVPNAKAFCFYMDMRMAGQFYEELYRKSQEKYGVTYIRGRISEAAATMDNRIQIKAEDTLSALPMKMTVDLLVLMVGIESSSSTTELSRQNDVLGLYGFSKSKGLYGNDNLTNQHGLFLAGTCKRPLTLPETFADARSAAIEIVKYLKTI
ncbi:MAG: CoB--CoM heterodisulfide reductase iron-sulfur subunit A family protein [Bacteroidales bacterium]|nr:CoB--CoM heterodisulfide reductase iron-sulfur subunit A family protein [Bacteroidales bacterium]